MRGRNEWSGGVGWLWLAFVSAGGIAPAQAVPERVIHNFGYFPNGAAPYGTLIRDLAGNLFGTAYQGGAAAQGAVFKVDPSGRQTVLYNFTGGDDGANPYAGVIRDPAGNLYGTTYQGGAAGAGVVYKLDPSGNETVLYTFKGGNDGANPYAGVVADVAGNLYGTTVNGGTANAGVVYKLSPSGETVLYDFKGAADGGNPYGGVIADADGNLYGTTRAGGRAGAGVLFKLDPSGHETVLHTFGPPSGEAPMAGVIRDAEGNLYGTATTVIYKLDAAGHYKMLRVFPYGITGGEASAGVVRDLAGNLYGTTDPADGPFPTEAPYGAVYKLDTAGQLTVLYSFPGSPQAGNVATGPNGGVVLDPAGNLFGATPYGGLGGMVYQVGTAGEAMLYSFPAAHHGTTPRAGVTIGPSGAIYGTTTNGGAANAGVVYKIESGGRETVLYSFTGGADGAYPQSGVTLDSAGNLYGTTEWGGISNAGVVYEVDQSGHETVLYNFTGGADGGYPIGAVILDPDGNLYGTTFGGGTTNRIGIPEGLVFKLDPSGHETVLHSFTGLADGGVPEAGLIRDSDGNLYGTTVYGGLGAGVVYEISPVGQETVLYSFTGGPDGGNPYAGVIRDPTGNLYGTNVNFGAGGGGVVFELTSAGSYSVLYSFTVGPDGNSPFGGVIRDTAGNLYGTATYGGDPGCIFGCGVVYQLDPSGTERVLHSFTGGADGSDPWAGVTQDSSGNLYGTTTQDGSAGGGVLFKLILQ
jgi:uncharacterized repeat protein (TIGR03803 family)